MISSPRYYDVLILGGGFAGVYCAKSVLQHARGRELSVAILASENHMVFQPMLAEVVGGSLSPRHVVNPIRLLCEGADVFKGKITRVNLDKKEVVLDAGLLAGCATFSYGHLVFSLGSDVNVSRIPGMAEHALLMRNAGDAMKLRATLVSKMEEANLIADPVLRKKALSFIVVGGGYSGVETAGQIQDLLRDICKYYESIHPSDVSVTLVHSGERLLPSLSPKLAHYTARQLEKMGVKILFNSRVKAVTATSVILPDGTRFQASIVVCTVGNAPHPILMNLGEQQQISLDRGKILVDNTGLVQGSDHLWAGGDCSRFPMLNGEPCPETAQFAYRQGLLIGKNIAFKIRTKKLKPFTFKGLGELASIGHHVAVANILGMNFSGLFAWFLWRTIYLMKLPGLDRKLRVMTEWTFDLFFPRDINLLTPEYSSPLKEMYLEPGDPLFHTGEPALSFYGVKAGRIDITDEHGTIIKTALTGDHFGERALLNDRVWRYDARAKEPSILVAISDRTFHKMVSSFASIRKLFLRTASDYDNREEIQHVLSKLPQSSLEGTARSIMSRQVDAIREDCKLQEALDLFQTARHSTYPVLDAENRVISLLRRGDCYEWLKHHPMDFQMTVKDLPQKPVTTISPDLSLPEVFEKFIRSSVSKAVVVDEDQKMLGMITLYDVLTQKKSDEPVSIP